MAKDAWRGYAFRTDGPAGAHENMARDEALLAAFRAGIAPPSWRIYSWRGPAVTFGYFQQRPGEAGRAAGVTLVVGGRAIYEWPGDVPLVRRLSGGGLVAHGADITYCVVRERRYGTANYEDIVGAVAQALNDLGVPADVWRRGDEGRRGFCFASLAPYDLHVGGRKIAGCAQRRLRDAVLHHGSIADDAPPPPARLGGIWDERRTTTVKEILGAPVGVARFAHALAGVLGLVPVSPADEIAVSNDLNDPYEKDS